MRHPRRRIKVQRITGLTQTQAQIDIFARRAREALVEAADLLE